MVSPFWSACFIFEGTSWVILKNHLKLINYIIFIVINRFKTLPLKKILKCKNNSYIYLR